MNLSFLFFKRHLVQLVRIKLDLPALTLAQQIVHLLITRVEERGRDAEVTEHCPLVGSDPDLSVAEDYKKLVEDHAAEGALTGMCLLVVQVVGLVVCYRDEAARSIQNLVLDIGSGVVASQVYSVDSLDHTEQTIETVYIFVEECGIEGIVAVD